MRREIIIVVLIIIICLMAIMYKLSRNEATYIRSDLTNKEYLVQNLDGKEEATHMLAVINQRINLFKQYLKNNIDKYPEYRPYIQQFCDRSKNLVLMENPPDGKYTSYTVNKGDEIALCLRSRRNGKLHNVNLITYVTLHELSHVACPEQDHTELFKKIFIFFLRIASEMRIYIPTDYKLYPTEYCGITVNENLLSRH
jgi:hypothetical protein